MPLCSRVVGQEKNILRVCYGYVLLLLLFSFLSFEVCFILLSILLLLFALFVFERQKEHEVGWAGKGGNFGGCGGRQII